MLLLKLRAFLALWRLEQCFTDFLVFADVHSCYLGGTGKLPPEGNIIIVTWPRPFDSLHIRFETSLQLHYFL
ncbi:hypothetical protein F5148DRAFT_1245968 [Russula earlei]|uniref:Uncharacterized protein n=1 Tax=Russula earlei TaxID=71964 RepID=A0ACC0TUH8_9AGAM|nr:hypothetical protein F5148DRAFT_1245968 [Russula earlei]